MSTLILPDTTFFPPLCLLLLPLQAFTIFWHNLQTFLYLSSCLILHQGIWKTNRRLICLVKEYLLIILFKDYTLQIKTNTFKLRDRIHPPAFLRVCRVLSQRHHKWDMRWWMEEQLSGWICGFSTGCLGVPIKYSSFISVLRIFPHRHYLIQALTFISIN